MSEAREPAAERVTADEGPSSAQPVRSELQALQRAIGNAATGRLLASPGGVHAMRRLSGAGGPGSARALNRWPWDKKPELLPDVPIEVERNVELHPVKPMNAPAEREREGVHPRTPEKFQPGDHAWYYPHPDPAVPRITVDLDIPRDLWFPGSTGPTDYKGHGMEIREYVIYPNEVREGIPHMRGKPGSMAWLNNNPGNLTADGNDHGQFAGKLNWHRFMIFPDHKTGYDAIYTWLRANGYFSLGIFDALSKYAPEKDGNDPVTYSNRVVSALSGETTAGAGRITLATTLGQLTREQMTKVQDAIEQMEGTIEGTTHSRDAPALPWEIRKRL